MRSSFKKASLCITSGFTSALAFLIIVFIFNADTDDLTTISPEELFEMIRTVDFVAIIQLPEFWSMALAPYKWKM